MEYYFSKYINNFVCIYFIVTLNFFLKIFSIRHIYDFTFMIYKLFNNYVTININNANLSK